MFRTHLRVLMASFVFAPVAWAAEPPVVKEKPPAFPAEIRKAWEKAGARTGWMRVYRDGYRKFLPESADLLANDLPGFSLGRMKIDALAQLPDPGIPFGLYCNFSDLNDDSAAYLKRFPSIRVLSLQSAHVTDKVLPLLVELKNMEELQFGYNQKITGVTLGELAKLEKLKYLDLGVTGTRDAGLKEIGKLKQLKGLSLYSAQISDGGFAALKDLKSLEWFNLNAATIGDGAMKIVGQNPELKWIDLYSTNVGDAGVKELRGLKKLEHLNLNQTKITDACIPDLAELTGLQKLEVGSSGVTYAGMKKHAASFQQLTLLSINFAKASDVDGDDLKRSYPKCQVNR